MKKNITINLFGQLYCIDEDACDLLEQYLDNMKRYFAQREGGDEISDDIEHRVAELFSELKENGTEAINIHHVQDIIHRIGNPEEMGAEAEEETNAQDDTKAQEQTDTTAPNHTADAPNQDANEGNHANKDVNFGTRPKGWFTSDRKLYRDSEDVAIGGVIAGLCKYFGTNDPLPWRIIMIILAFVSFQTFTILYLIAWALIPQARTVEDKLRMRGKPINPQTLNEELMRTTMNPQSAATSTQASLRPARGCLGTLLSILVLGLKLLAFFFLGIATIITFMFLALLVAVVVEHPDMAILFGGTFNDNFVQLLLTDRTMLWTGWGIVISGSVFLILCLYGLIRSVMSGPNTRPLRPATRTILIIVALAAATTAMTLTAITGKRTEALSERAERTINSEGGYYLKGFERKRLTEEGWNIRHYVNCNRNGRVSEIVKSPFDQNDRVNYLRFKRDNGSLPMQVDLYRQEFGQAGRYHIEALAYSKSKGIWIYGCNENDTIRAEVPTYSPDNKGNITTQMRDSLAHSALFTESIDEEDWNKWQAKRLSGWSYVRTPSFVHDGKTPIAYGITNVPSTVALHTGEPTGWNFCLLSIKLVYEGSATPATSTEAQ